MPVAPVNHHPPFNSLIFKTRLPLVGRKSDWWKSYAEPGDPGTTVHSLPPILLGGLKL